MNKLIYKGNLNDFDIFAGLGIVKGNWNERALKYLHYLGATSSGLNTAQKQIEEANLETLRLDFVNQDYAVGSADVGAVETKDTFDNILTFSRGSTGTYFDSAGVLQTAAVDEPRFTHDPESLEAQGLLIEEQRTNLLLWSEAFDASPPWTALAGGTGSITVTANSGEAPDGSNTAERLQMSLNGGTTSTDSAGIRQTPGWETTGISYTLSVWLKSFDGSTYSIILDFNGSTPKVVTVTGEWERFSNTLPSLDTSARPLYAARLRGNMGSSDTADILVWGAQLEQGSFPTSYIKTEGSQVTRSVDNCSRTLGDEYNSSEGRVKAVAKNHAGEFILNLGTQSTLADVDTEKTYTLTYSSDPSASTLDLLSSGAGTVKSVKYYPREAV